MTFSVIFERNGGLS